MQESSLRSKFVLGITVIIALLGAAIILLVNSALSRDLTRELGRKGILAARHLSHMVVNPVLTERRTLLQMMINDYMSYTDDIEYVFVQDKDGEVLAHTFQGGFPVDLKHANTISHGDEYRTQLLATGKGEVIDIAFHVMKGEVGTVHIGMSERHLERTASGIQTVILATVFLVLVIGIAATALFSARLTRPLSELVVAATEIGQGSLEHRVKVNTKDEIGHLGSAFNRMIEDLQKTTVSRDYLDNIVKSMMEALIVADPTGRIQIVNRATLDLLGYDEEYLIGKPLTVVFAPGKYGNVDIEELRHKGFVRDCEKTCLTRDGRKIPVIFSASIVRAGNSPDESIVCVARNITELKQAEAEKARLYAQLQHVQKLEAIGQLAGGIAHDFNNILVPLLGFAELAKEEVDAKSEASSSLDEVIKAGKRAKDLTRQILTFSRQTEQEFTPLDIVELVNEAVKFLRSSIPSTIDIQTDIEVERGMLLGDPTQIHQLLANLCINAVHAMEEKGGLLKIGLANVEIGTDDLEDYPSLNHGSYLQIIVSDTGHGIDRAVMERIFDPYFTTKPIGKGTGLGLSVVHGIVKSHGGAVTVDSLPGRGATFKVLLPACAEASSEAGDLELYRPVPGGTERILFVDDEGAITDLQARILTRLGYEVTPRTSSIEALEAFRAEPNDFDLVITDQTMPNMTGSELAKELFRIRPDIPVILCTGFTEAISADQAKAIGISEYVLKPVLRNDLAVVIRRVLDRT